MVNDYVLCHQIVTIIWMNLVWMFLHHSFVCVEVLKWLKYLITNTAKTVVLYSTLGTRSNRHEIPYSCAKSHGICLIAKKYS